MSVIEIYGKWRVRPGCLSEFIETCQELASTARRDNPEIYRCDWFVHDGAGEGISMAVYRDTAALSTHVATCGVLYDRLTPLASVEWQWVGRPEASALAALTSPASIVDFDSGLADSSGANQFARSQQSPATPAIEIFTRFAIRPGALGEFRRYAQECLRRVSASDPGTTRYDWFYDVSGQVCLALDTYRDTASMLAHMKNCHEPHAELLKMSTMTTEFLGEMPPDARAAIEKYRPYVARFVAGMKS